MSLSTDGAEVLGSLEIVDPEGRRQGLSKGARNLRRTRIWSPRTTRPHLEKVGSEVADQIFVAPRRVEAEVRREVVANGTPIEIWEGVVKDVDAEGGTMSVYLEAKMGKMQRHTADIELEWVTEQDKDLLRPGAVFYLTLFKRTSPSVENAQELRFRRRPFWNDAQLKQVEADAAMIASKLKPRPLAE